jgi:hypothetical protein
VTIHERTVASPDFHDGRDILLVAPRSSGHATGTRGSLSLGTTTTSDGRMSANTCIAGWMQKGRFDYRRAHLLSHGEAYLVGAASALQRAERRKER